MEDWSFKWAGQVGPGTITVLSRAVDDRGYLQPSTARGYLTAEAPTSDRGASDL